LNAQFIPRLPQQSPVFVPDLPGYGASAPIKDNDKLSVGKVVLSAVKTQVKRSSSQYTSANIPIILVGHDRGARVAHRLAVSGYQGVDINGVCLIDIVSKQRSNPIVG
jgi:pimeloyl-ACP methyl ester carboxylesterase